MQSIATSWKSNRGVLRRIPQNAIGSTPCCTTLPKVCDSSRESSHPLFRTLQMQSGNSSDFPRKHPRQSSATFNGACFAPEQKSAKFRLHSLALKSLKVSKLQLR